jgi:transcription elongation factor GreA
MRLKLPRFSPIIPLPKTDPDNPLLDPRAEPAAQEPGFGEKGIFSMATADKVPMLAEGHRKIDDEVRHLKMVERPAIIEAIEMARAHGDLAENAEYHAAKERQGQVEATIADLEDRLSRAQIIDPTTLSGDKVVFGATVTLIDEDKKKIRYQLVGQTEADAKVGRISYNSPLGRALIGRTVGEEVEVSTPSGERYYKIKGIEFV